MASPLHLLHRAGQCAESLLQEDIAELGLTPRQFALLAAVSKYDGLSQTELSAKTKIDRSTMAELVRRLLQRGLLQRVRSAHDCRAYAVSLTDSGRRSLAAAEPLADRANEKLLALLPEFQAESLLRDLSELIGSLDGTPA